MFEHRYVLGVCRQSLTSVPGLGVVLSQSVATQEQLGRGALLFWFKLPIDHQQCH